MRGKVVQRLWEQLRQRREGIGQTATKSAEADPRNQGQGKVK